MKTGLNIYSHISGIDLVQAKDSAWLAVLRFLHNTGVINSPMHEGFVSHVMKDKELETITSERAGILYQIKNTGDFIKQGDVLAQILDPFTGSIRNKIVSPINGTLFFSQHSPLVEQNSFIFKIAKI